VLDQRGKLCGFAADEFRELLRGVSNRFDLGLGELIRSGQSFFSKAVTG